MSNKLRFIVDRTHVAMGIVLCLYVVGCFYLAFTLYN